MRDHAISSLWTAHHAGDQLETHLLRYNGGMEAVSRLGEGWRVEDWEERRVVRVLLGVGKARLKATCEEAGVEWAVDPTNEDAGYARRNGLRAKLRGLQERHFACVDQLGVATDESGGPLTLLHRSLANYSLHRTSPALSTHLRQLVSTSPTSPLSLNLRPASLPHSLPPATFRSLLRLTIQHVAPERATISSSALEHARTRLLGLCPPAQRSQQLTPGGGVVLIPPRASEPGVWRVERQAGRRGERRRERLVTGEGVLWDGRVWCKLERAGEGEDLGMVEVGEVEGGVGVWIDGQEMGQLGLRVAREGVWRSADGEVLVKWRRKVWGVGNGGWAEL